MNKLRALHGQWLQISDEVAETLEIVKALRLELANLRRDTSYLLAEQSKKTLRAAAEVDTPEMLAKRHGLPERLANQVDWERMG